MNPEDFPAPKDSFDIYAPSRGFRSRPVPYRSLFDGQVRLERDPVIS